MKYREDYKTNDKAWYEPVPNLTSNVELEVKFFKCHPEAKLPERANEDDAGWDLFSTEEVVWHYDARPQTAPTGLKMVIPSGWEAQVRPRSGMSLKGLTVCNSPGTIDAGYRGEIKVIVAPTNVNTNASNSFPIIIPKGTKIAQLVFKRVPQTSIKEISEEEFEKLSNTTRGEGGFGSTGQ